MIPSRSAMGPGQVLLAVAPGLGVGLAQVEVGPSLGRGRLLGVGLQLLGAGLDVGPEVLEQDSLSVHEGLGGVEPGQVALEDQPVEAGELCR